jgi:general secretion pathway protein E
VIRTPAVFTGEKRGTFRENQSGGDMNRKSTTRTPADDPSDLLRNDLPKAEPADEECLLRGYAETLGIPFRRGILEEMRFKGTLNIPIHYFRRMGLIPLSIEADDLTVAINNPLNFQAADDLARMMGCKRAKLILSPLEDINSAINVLFDQSSSEAEKVVQDLGETRSEEDVFTEIEEMEDLMDVNHEAPIIRLVNVILTQALRRKASDVHVEPYFKEVKVRFRLDGILYEIFSLPKRFQPHIIARIKVMANLDIAEKRLPQDGRMKIKVANKAVDIRVSIIPMAYGERIVLRLLDKTVSLMGLAEMGLNRDGLRSFEKLIRKNSGIILVTGPTGSGKSTTLYAALNSINSTEKNIITIEDPIEYELKGVGQIQVNRKTDLTFARGLRSVLRHDPDIIMVGEIRDLDTVEIALQASLTGHLVFSTLHTNDAAGALTRMVDMGVEPFLIASSLLAVLAQRLVRTICPACKEPFQPDRSTLLEFGLPEDLIFYRGKGCPQCVESGYRGRTGIFELLVVENETRRLLTSGADSVTIKQAAVRRGMTTLFEDGIRKVKEGITTLGEVLRVTQE